jgi:hypothetical protein
MKAVAIAAAALTVFDAVAFGGEYRHACAAFAWRLYYWVMAQPWDSFLVG